MVKIEFNPQKEEFINNYKKLKSAKRMSEFYHVNLKHIYAYAKKINYTNTLKKDISWQPKDKEVFVLLYNQLKSSNLLAEHYGVSKRTVLKYAQKIGYINDYRNSLTEKEVRYILENYYFKTSITLSEKLGVSKSLITKTWRENNLKGKCCRRYYINENYFSKINSKDKAYFLGILASDGCIYSRNDSSRLKMISMIFHIQEKEIIDMFIRYTDAEYKPYIRSNKITLQINSNKMVDDLKQYHIVERKTWIYTPYVLDDYLMWHYLRGFFDGDGSIYYSGKYNPCNWIISIFGNYKTMYAIQNFLKTQDIECHVRLDNRTEKYKNDFYNLVIRKNSEKIKFIKKLYNDSENLRLNRKYVKCEEFLKLYNERHPN